MWKSLKCGKLASQSEAHALPASLPVGRLKLVLLSVALGCTLSVRGLAKQLTAGAVVKGSMDVDPHLCFRISQVEGHGRRFRQSQIYHKFFEQRQLRLRR